MASFDRAMTLRADLADAHFNAALFLLLVGELGPGCTRRLVPAGRDAQLGSNNHRCRRGAAGYARHPQFGQ
jgi:hypothetical protein